MALSYVEELALRYFEKSGYLVFPNIRFQLKREWTGKKVSGWSDIDMIALKPDELVIVQCKSFLGTKKGEDIANDVINWFKYAELFLRENNKWKVWLDKRKIRKCLIVDYTVKKVEPILNSSGIEVLYYNRMLTELLRMLKEGEVRKGKEDDVIIRLLCAMIDKDMLNPKYFKNNGQKPTRSDRKGNRRVH